jgi:hypothetical protein
MATGNQVVPGAPASADHAAAGPPVTAGHAPRLGGPQASWPMAAAQTAAPHGPPPAGYAATGGRAGGYRPAQAGYQPPDELAERDVTRKPARLWPGAGGRWLVWVFRMVLWTVLLLIGYRGVAAIVMGSPGPGSTPAAPATGPAAGGDGQAGQFPAALAQAYALEFGQVYLNFSPARAAQRARSLAAFLPPGSDPAFGWNEAATRALQSEQVAGIRVLDHRHAVVTLLARVNGGLIELGVPIYAKGAGLVVSGYPALLPAPARVALPRQAGVRPDRSARHALSLVLPAFFRAYASGDGPLLRRFSAADGSVAGLSGAVRFARISRISVPASPGATRHLTVTVVWKVGGQADQGHVSPAAAPGELTMSYAMTVVRHRASWLVRSISASAVRPWPAP